jgi:hypothetical protein
MESEPVTEPSTATLTDVTCDVCPCPVGCMAFERAADIISGKIWS